MLKDKFVLLFIGLATLACFQACAFETATGAGLLTAGERAVQIENAELAAIRAENLQNQFLSELDRTIRRANLGIDSQSLRQPVSENALQNLQTRLASRGIAIPKSELRAATDYAQALLVESKGEVSLAEKVNKLPGQLRAPFHGKVAELAEARERGMVLNKSATGTTWDLTEPKFQPRNYQMKIYAQSGRSLSSMYDDLDKKELYFTKRGISDKQTLERGVKSGRLVREGKIYRYASRNDIELEPSKVFSRPAESHLYAKTGRESLIKRGLAGEKAVPSGFQTAGKWLGRAGVVALVATEGYIIQGFASGRLNEREFVTAQSAIAGGGLGGWGGAEAGAGIGLLVAGGPEDPLAAITVPVGAIVGGIVGSISGAKLGEMGASGFYGRLDDDQKRQVEAFIYKHYNVAQ